MPKMRCPWVNLENPDYVLYHDCEWGKPVHDDLVHFEFITLEGAQAGLSWEIILKKREGYRKLFSGFDPKKISRYSEKKISDLLNDARIVRNKLKIQSTIINAKAFLAIQQEFGSFDAYIWGFVQGESIVNKPKTLADYPTRSELSDRISKDLKKRGFKFVGTTIIYAYLQAVGIINDHVIGCGFRQNNVNPKKWYVYMIRCADNSLYTGIASDLHRRVAEHQSQTKKCAKYLRGKHPLELVFQLEVTNQGAALRLEAQIKKLSKLEKEKLITNT